MTRKVEGILAAAATVVSAMACGCASVWPEGSTVRGDGRALACPPLARGAACLLASDLGESEAPQEVSLPPMDRWPRIFADAGPFYALGQFSPLVVPMGDLAANDRVDLGYGVGVAFGYRLPLTNVLAVGVEAQFEFSEHTNVSADVAAHQSRIGAAVRVIFKFDENLRPFGVVGGGQYEMKFDSVPSRFHLSGPGLLLGGGADYIYLEQLTIRGELTYHLWDAAEKGDTSKGGTAQTLCLGVGAAYSF